MKVGIRWRHTPALIGALVISALLGGCLDLSGRHVTTADISGVVRSLESRTPVAGATVTINDHKATTLADGTYAISQVPINNRRVWFHASAPGHISQTGSIPAVGGASLRLDIDLPFATIPGSGKVTGRLNFSVPEFAVGYDCPPANLLDFNRLLGTGPKSSLQRAELITSTEVVVELWSPPTLEIAKRLAANVGAKSFRISEIIDRIILEAPDSRDFDAFLARVKQESDVIDAYPNEILMLPMGLSSAYAVTPNDPCYGVLHHLHQVNAPLAWNATTGDRSVVVAVVDTGVDTEHPELAPNLIPGGNMDSRDCDLTPDTFGDEVIFDCTGHGTHVSGIIGAIGNNGLGVAGVAWDVSILPVRVVPLFSATIEAVVGGIRFATNSGSDIINISIATAVEVPPIREAIEDAIAQGIIVVASVGNSGPGKDNTSTWVRYDGVIGVGAVSYDDPTTIANFSSGGPGVDLVAPGEEVWSTIPGGGYVTAAGTSMSAPVVSGVIALMLANGIRPSDVPEILLRTAVRIGDPENNIDDLYTYGYGLVNAYGAVMGVDPADAILLTVNGDGRIVGSNTSPDSQRRYEIEHVPEGDVLYLVGWIDVNGSETLDMGDYFGLKEFSISDGGRVTVDLDLDVYDRLEEIDLSSKWIVDLEALKRL